MGYCCVKEKIDVITEINTIEGLIKVFSDDRTLIEQRKNIFLKFKNKNSQYNPKEMEFALKFKDITTDELNKILVVYDRNLEGLENLLKELKQVEMFFNEKCVKLLMPCLTRIRAFYDLIEDKENLIETSFKDTSHLINDILAKVSKRKG